MEKGDYKNGTEILIRNKKFNPEKYAMAVCPICKSKGYVQNPKRQCCSKCGGFGFIMKEKEVAPTKGKEINTGV
jgi:RecJ-like exonuclease